MLMSFQAILLPLLFFMSRSPFTKPLMMNSCFPQAGTHPFHRQLAKSSALCFQSSTTGKVSYDQQRKGTESRKAKEVLGDTWRVPWWAQTPADVVMSCNFPPLCLARRCGELCWVHTSSYTCLSLCSFWRQVELCVFSSWRKQKRRTSWHSNIISINF